MPSIIGGSTRVVETEAFTIDELAGNVATQSDTVSIAHCKVLSPTSEPWLTLHYDEWMCVMKGRMLLHHAGAGSPLEVKAGQTVMVRKGERFRPEFPEAGTEYIPVCIPAFRPDRCIREDDTEEGHHVAKKLKTLHTTPAPVVCVPARPQAEVLYHMCEKRLWDAAKTAGAAYYPPTFEADGMTHATSDPVRLLTIANHFYTDRPGDWVCLVFRVSALRKCGIIVKEEEAMPVGDKSIGEDWDWVCPHVYGGIPPSVVEKELPIVRESGLFKSIQSLA